MKIDDNKNILTPGEIFQNNPDACFQKAETNLLIDALKRSHTERFMMATNLYKISMMIKKATIKHQPFKAKV
jgi:hypothetical protein